MNDDRGAKNAAAPKRAAATAGHAHPYGLPAGDIDAGLMKYLAAEQYHEKVEEAREDEADHPNQGR